MAAASKAIPSHLRDGASSNGDAGGIKPRHHGKSQSHMVSAGSIFSRKQFKNLTRGLSLEDLQPKTGGCEWSLSNPVVATFLGRDWRSCPFYMQSNMPSYSTH